MFQMKTTATHFTLLLLFPIPIPSHRSGAGGELLLCLVDRALNSSPQHSSIFLKRCRRLIRADGMVRARQILITRTDLTDNDANHVQFVQMIVLISQGHAETRTSHYYQKQY